MQLIITIEIPDGAAAGRSPEFVANAVLFDPDDMTIRPVPPWKLQSAYWADGGPVVVGSSGGFGCDSGEFPAVAIFATRQLAEAAITDHDDAVRRAEADGIKGFCHVGDYKIAGPDDIALFPASLRQLYGPDDNLYLLRYWPPIDGS